MGNLLKNGCGCVVMLVGGVLLVGMFSGKRPAREREVLATPEVQPRTVENAPTPNANNPVERRLQDDVSITLEVNELPSRHVRLTGSTNLPLGTNLMLRVEERVPGGFRGSSKSVVADDGSFESESFGPKDGFPSGFYFATVVMPDAQVQPDSVKQIIGNRGEHLSGPLVKQGTIGVTVSTELEFSIGDSTARSSQHERMREMLSVLKKVRAELTSMHKQLVNHSRYLESENIEDKKRWGVFARQFTVRIQEIRGEIEEALPLMGNEARIHARLVAGDLLSVFLDTASSVRTAERSTEQYHLSLDDLDGFIERVETQVTSGGMKLVDDAANGGKVGGAADESAMKRARSYIALTKQLLQSGKAGEPEAKWMQKVIEDLPDTELAAQAAELLKQIPQ